MISRVVTVQIKPGSLDEAVHIYQEGILPIVQQQKGYRQVLVLTDTENNKLLIVGLWDDEASLKAADGDARLVEQIRLFGATFAARPAIENLEVRLRDKVNI